MSFLVDLLLDSALFVPIRGEWRAVKFDQLGVCAGKVVLMTAFGLAMVTLPVLASECRSGNSEKLVLVNWVSAHGRLGPRITYEFRSTLKQAVRSVNAELVFEDLDGRSLGSLTLNPDVKIGSGETRKVIDDMLGGEALGSLAREKVAAKICTRSVEYSGGTFDEF